MSRQVLDMTNDRLEELFQKTNGNFEEVYQKSKDLEQKNASQDTEISGKASQNDYNTLKARVDLLTQTPSEETEGNAELIDIRVGADGRTYPTAGEAVRTFQTREEFAVKLYGLRLDIDSNNHSVKLSRISSNSHTVVFSNQSYAQLYSVADTLPFEANWDTLLDGSNGFTFAIMINRLSKQLFLRRLGGDANSIYENTKVYGDIIICSIFINYLGIIQSVNPMMANNIYLNGNLISLPHRDEYNQVSDAIIELDANNVINLSTVSWAIGHKGVRLNINQSAEFLAEVVLTFAGNEGILWFDKTSYYCFRSTDEGPKKLTLHLSDYQSPTSSGDTYLLVLDSSNQLKLISSHNLASHLSLKDRVICEIWFGNNGGVIKIACYNSEIKDIFYVNGSKYFTSSIKKSDIVDFSVDKDDLNFELPGDKLCKEYGISDIGCLEYEEIGETDYSHIILYGQSLSMGWEAPEVITTTPVKNCYMVGSSPMINHGNDGTKVLNELKAVKWSSGGEQPIVSAVNAFAKMYNRFVDKTQKFIGTNCGEGGRSIERLSKNCTNGTNYYTTEFLDAVNSVKEACDDISATVSCSAIIFMQGEHNYTNLTGAGLTEGTDATNDKDTYKNYLLQLKNDMQADIMSIYGQSHRPLFFVYQVAGNYINNKEMTINMAQVEFAQENEDVILLNSTYGVPDYNGGHLSTNGYRWYGELIAKQLYEVFVRGIHYKSVNLEDIIIKDNKIELYYHVPVLPLVFDTYTKESITNYGYRVYMNNTEQTITNISIDNNKVILEFGSNLSGEIEITYGGQGRSGSGNLRDSDEYYSLYTYFDDRETSPNKREQYTPKDSEGNYIYGKKYPMYNWGNQFYRKITIS